MLLHRPSFPLLFSVLLLLAVGQGCTYPKGLTGSPSERTSEPELREGFLPVTLKRTASFDSCRLDRVQGAADPKTKPHVLCPQLGCHSRLLLR